MTGRTRRIFWKGRPSQRKKKQTAKRTKQKLTHRSGRLGLKEKSTGSERKHQSLAAIESDNQEWRDEKENAPKKGRNTRPGKPAGLQGGTLRTNTNISTNKQQKKKPKRRRMPLYRPILKAKILKKGGKISEYHEENEQGEPRSNTIVELSLGD